MIKLMLIVFWFGQPLSMANTPAPSPTPGPHQQPLSLATAVFAGGCFWCMQPPFDALAAEGVTKTEAGYCGGAQETATYEQVSAGKSGHREVVQVTYDPSHLTFSRLLEVFFENIDPFNSRGQFCDQGDQYKAAIYVANEAERKEANAAIETAKTRTKAKGEFRVDVLDMKTFYAAEKYHQDYYKENPLRYRFYRSRCGRDDRLLEVWGKLPSFKQKE